MLLEDVGENVLRKRKRKRIAFRVGISFLVLLLFAGICVCFWMPLQILPHSLLQFREYPKHSAMLTKEQVKADANQMVEFVENVHPAFLQAPTEQYRKAKDTYLKTAGRSAKTADFQAATSRYLASLKDGHTHLFWDETSLPVHWKYKKGSLVIGSGCELPENSKVVSIGGVPVSEILKQVSSLFPAENDAGLAYNYEIYSTYRSVLSVAGVPEGGSAKITSEIGGVTVTKTILFEQPSVPVGTDSAVPVESKEQEGTFVVTLRQCDLGEELDKTIEKLKTAINHGTKKVVIDGRDNPGGQSLVCTKLLNAISMYPGGKNSMLGGYGFTVRFSGPAAKQEGYLRKSGSWATGCNKNALRNDKIRLYVLTNAGTYSSATMLGVWVQDGHLGKVVGQPSGNSPSCYGDCINFQLKNSKLYGTISHVKWLRPDESANQKVLVPDIMVPDGQDALEVALHQLP